MAYNMFGGTLIITLLNSILAVVGFTLHIQTRRLAHYYPIILLCCETRCHSYKLVKSRCSHDICKYFFTNRIVDLWNSLPNEIVSVNSLQAFRYKVSHLNL